MPWKRLGCGNALPINMVMLEGSIAEQVLGIVRMPFFFLTLSGLSHVNFVSI